MSTSKTGASAVEMPSSHSHNASWTPVTSTLGAQMTANANASYVRTYARRSGRAHASSSPAAVTTATSAPGSA